MIEENADSSAYLTATVRLRCYKRQQPNVVVLEEREVDVTGCLPLDRAAEIMGVANVVPRLTEEGIIASNGLPYLHYLEWGYFALGERAQILLTPKGLVWFGKRYRCKVH